MAAEFVEGEMVLAKHGSTPYLAKIKKIEKKKGKIQFFVHYDGWNTKWDEYVTEDRLEKATEASKALAQQKQEALREQEKKKKRSRKGESATPSKSSKKQKTKAIPDEELEAVDNSVPQAEVKLKLPGSLKKQLIVDWECVIRQKQIVSLPRSPTVSQLLRDFETSKVRKGSIQTETKEVCEGLEQYFNRALGTVLLYRFERPQYNNYFSSSKEQPANVYGAEHLLRLFVKLPSLLAHTSLDKSEVTTLQQRLAELLKWLTTQQSTIFLDKYQDTDSSYHSQVEV